MPADTLVGVSVREVMTPNPVYISPAATIRELAELLDSNEISGVPVLDVRERVIGVVSKTDLLSRWISGSRETGSSSFLELLEDGLQIGEYVIDDQGRVEEFMSVDPVTTTPDKPITDIARRMVSERVHRVIVVDDDMRLKGIVTTLDILKHLSE